MSATFLRVFNAGCIIATFGLFILYLLSVTPCNRKISEPINAIFAKCGMYILRKSLFYYIA